jgi:hypothetical protein
MKCPKCGFENPDNANFCIHCGAALKEVTPAKEEKKEEAPKEEAPLPREVVAPKEAKPAPTSSPVSQKLAKASIITGACVLSAPVGVGLGAAALALSKNEDEKKKALIGLILSGVLTIGVAIGGYFAARSLRDFLADHLQSSALFTSYAYEDGATYTVDAATFAKSFDGANSPKVKVVNNHYGRNIFYGRNTNYTIYDGNSAVVVRTSSTSSSNRFLSLQNKVLTSYSKKDGVWSKSSSDYDYSSIHAGVFELRYHTKDDDLASFFASCAYDETSKTYSYSEKNRSDITLDDDYSVYSLTYSFFFKNNRLYNIRYAYSYQDETTKLTISDETLFSEYDTTTVTFPSDMPIE